MSDNCECMNNLKHIYEYVDLLDKKADELIDQIKNIELTPGEKGDSGEKGQSLTYDDLSDTQKKELATLASKLIQNGKDGHTPEKGVDYYTDADKKEIFDVINKYIKNIEPKVIKETKTVYRELTKTQKSQILDVIFKEVDLSIPTTEEIARNLEDLENDVQLDPLKGLKDFRKAVRQVQHKPKGTFNFLTPSQGDNRYLKLTTSDAIFGIGDNNATNATKIVMADNTADYFLMADGTDYQPVTPASARTGLDVYSTGEADGLFIQKAPTANDNLIQVTTADKHGLILQSLDNVKAAYLLQNRKKDGTVTGGFDARGVLVSNLGVDYNSFYAGESAGNVAATGTKNYGIGRLVFSRLTSGTSNSAMGYLAGQYLTTGGFNVLIGDQAGRYLTTGGSNILIGRSAGQTLVSGTYQIMIGSLAGANATGTNDTLIGEQAGRFSNGFNTVVGSSALSQNTGVVNLANNVALGRMAAEEATTCINSVVIGERAVDNAITISDSIILGYRHLTAESSITSTFSLGSVNTSWLKWQANLFTVRGGIINDPQADVVQLTTKAFSTQTANIKENYNNAGDLVSGIDQRGIPFAHGGTPTDNYFAGLGAGNVVGEGNAGIGFQALGGNSGGTVGTDTDYNVAIGYRSHYNIQATSSRNTIIGSEAAYTGPLIDNIFIGYRAGYYQTGSNVLLVANERFADAATELTNSILYGVMAADPEDQTLRVNAKFETTQGRMVNTTRVTTTYTALVTDHEIFCDTDGGAFTITLPVGVDGQKFRIINCGSSGNDLTIDGNGAENVRGAATQIVSDSEIMIITYETTEQWW